MSEPVVYLNGAIVPAAQAHLPIFDAGIVQGATVAEMTRTFRHRLWRLHDHLDRLFGALRHTRMDIGMSQEELARISEEVAARNAQLIDQDDELGLIQFVTAGENPMYAGRAVRTTPTVCVHTFPLPFERWAKKMETGAHVVTPSIRHVPPQCYDPRMKCRSRMHFFLADQEARLVDPDAISLLLDLQGNIAETSAANFLMVDRGTIISPTTVNTLPGISRAMVIELAAKLGIPFVERDIQVDDVMNAGEALLTSTPYCVMPVTKMNGAAIGGGRPGPMFRRLLTAWSEVVGVDIGRQIEEGARRQGH
ncbi:MAG: aminotransferase class IV [Gemmataceae bacterium]|nr:aminotransferase class IV [Gemmataceae bacterium]